jgi:hypothetical protein
VVMMPAGDNSLLIHQSSMAVLPSETSGASRRNGRRSENVAYQYLKYLYLLHRSNRIFPLTSLSRPALGPTQTPVQWAPEFSPWVKRGRGVTLTAHPHLMPRS